MRNARSALGVAMAVVTGCLVANPAFTEPDADSIGAESTGAPTCDIESDPLADPDSEAEATVQPEVRIFEGGSGIIEGALPLESSAWWGRIGVRPDTACGVDVAAELEVPESDLGLRICGFVECVPPDEAVLRIHCGTGDVVLSPFGRPGCCADALLTMQYECNFWDNTLFVRVEPTQGPVCTPFQINFQLQNDPIDC